MAEVIRMPRISDTMEEGTIVAWLKEVGDAVEAGDTIAEVETDKATMELDSYVDGFLLHIEVQEGTVPINGVIAVIGEEGEDWKGLLDSSNEPATTKSEVAAPAAPAEQPASPAIVSNESVSDDDRIKASPLAKAMAKESGIDLAAVAGSGDNGRIIKRDIEKVMSNGAAIPQPTQPKIVAPSAEAGTYVDHPVSNMRKTIARRLGESKFGAPHFYLTVEIDMDNAIKLRKQLNEVAPTKLSFNDLVIKAASVSLRKHPAINSSWLGDKIRENKEVNIGVAVAVDDGLMVPVVRKADIKTLSQINTEVKDLAGKAKDKRLGMDEMQGNTFTISNLGMFGIEEFTAIINPPDACILAVGGISQKPVVKNGEIVVGNRMKVTLSCDHRVVDGAQGASFLKDFKTILEDPIRILV
jgi:pyruvate dehydrogenase E2 component (dihydrolipoamide acetyltransferase)